MEGSGTRFIIFKLFMDGRLLSAYLLTAKHTCIDCLSMPAAKVFIKL